MTILDIQPRQTFRGYVAASDGYTVTLCNVRADDGHFLPGEIQKKGKVFANVKAGDHISFRSRLTWAKGGADALTVITCVEMLPQRYNPQTDMMNPRQMYKQLTWWTRRNPVSRKEGGEEHHLVPHRAIKKHGYRDHPRFRAKVTTWCHYLLHRFYARWKDDEENWRAVKTFMWKHGAALSEGNADFVCGLNPPRYYLMMRMKVPVDQYDDYLFLYALVIKRQDTYLANPFSREQNFHSWLGKQKALLDQMKGTRLDTHGIAAELGGLGRMIQCKIEDLMSELMTALLNNSSQKEIQVARRNLIKELRRNCGFMLNFMQMARSVYKELRSDMLFYGAGHQNVPPKFPWSISELLTEVR